MEAARSARGYYRLRTGFRRFVGVPLRVDFRSFVSDRTQYFTRKLKSVFHTSITGCISFKIHKSWLLRYVLAIVTAL